LQQQLRLGFHRRATFAVFPTKAGWRVVLVARPEQRFIVQH
jgi:hypothetical protein